MDESGKVYVIEANPNPQLGYGEDFAESAERAGVSYEQLLQRISRRGCSGGRSGAADLVARQPPQKPTGGPGDQEEFF